MEQRSTVESAVGAEVTIDGRRYINYGGSSYLGLSSNPAIIAAGVDALQRCGAGIPFHRSQSLVHAAYEEVESEAARFFGSASALFIATGYLFGLISIAGI